MEISEMNIYQRMAAITAELQTVAKNLEVKAGTGTYKGVSERDVLDAVKPLEEKYRVYSYPKEREILESTMLVNEKTYKDTVTKTNTFFSRIKTVYVFVNIDSPTEQISTITFAEGIDTMDKGSGKAMTYSDKYALLKAYKISTGEDPDQTASEPENLKKIYYTGIKCEKCKKPIPPAQAKNGTMMTAEQVTNFSIEKTGMAYCADCFTAMAAK